jgi:2-dehydro-3-deoxy-D-arabinonate dehydratase
VQLVRYRTGRQSEVRVGVCHDDQVTQLPGVGSLAELLSLPLEQLRARLSAAPVGDGTDLSTVELLAPVDGRTEVWAAGVTYQTSREARVEESERAATVYELVYDAPRPELFLKSVAWRVVGPGGQIGIREDSTVDVPEPELALVVNRFGEIVGYTICDDVSSRSIEGENPLYLPQAKLFYGCCGLGPWIRPAWEVPDPYRLAIEMRIRRDGRLVWSGTADTSLLHRRLDELVGYLMRGDVHPDGVLLSTGTCLVPPAPFTLGAGDTVQITIDGVGTLTNTVTRGRPGSPRPR